MCETDSGVYFVVSAAVQQGQRVMFSMGRGRNWMMGVKGKEKQAQSIDFHCDSLEA